MSVEDNPSHPGHGFVVDAARYVHAWICRCGASYGTEEHFARVPPPTCPVCGKQTESAGVTDRRPNDAPKA